jgi:hypothetical protein
MDVDEFEKEQYDSQFRTALPPPLKGTVMSLRLPASFGLSLAVLFVLTPDSQGHFFWLELQTVPIERLITNLDEKVKKDPKNVEALVNLARVHGMAYAWKTETSQVWKGHEERGAWFGYTPKTVPYSAVVKTDDPVKQKAAKAHLVKAINHFREALNRAPADTAARLGYAWTLDQVGHKNEAITKYRSLIEDAWKNEEREESLPLNGETVVTEAAGYLIPLLDKDKDKQEIAMLTKRVAQLRNKPRPITPIAVPLRDGLVARDLEDHDAAVAFDADGSALKRQWTWVTKDAGWLVYDPNGKGEITSSLQLFGNVTFWLFWDNGYDALASLDDNGDRVLTGNELKGVAIWHDVSHPGICDPGEVKPLSEYGIVALSCRYERDRRHPNQIAFSPNGVTFQDGKTRPTFDLILEPANRRSPVLGRDENEGNIYERPSQ